MSPETALAVRPSGAIAKALEAAGFLQAVTEGKCNLVTPAMFLDQAPALHRLAVRAVTLDVERETYKSPNGKEGEVALGAVALQKIARNAQVNWEDPKRLDDGKEPYLRTYQVGGTIVELDGQRTRLMPGVVTLDYRGEPDWPTEKLGADARSCLLAASRKDKTPSKWEIPAGTKSSNCRDCQQPAFWVKTDKGKNVLVNPDGSCHFDTCEAKPKAQDGWGEVFQARHFIDRLCVTKAMSACIRKLGIPASLPKERAEKPWIVMAMIQDLDMSDPVQKRAALAQCLGGSFAMYGAPPTMPAPPPEPINITPAPQPRPHEHLDPGQTVNGDGVIYEPPVPAVGQAEPGPPEPTFEEEPPPVPLGLPIPREVMATLSPKQQQWAVWLNQLAQETYDRLGADEGRRRLAQIIPPGFAPSALTASAAKSLSDALKSAAGRAA